MQTIHDYYRFCPDNVEVKISDAVCVGRRRANYPHCEGCQFNDDEKDGKKSMSQTNAVTDGREKIQKVFKAYDVRGVYPDPLDEEMAWRIGHATALYFRQIAPAAHRADTSKMTIVVGQDMRKSSPSMADALIDGIRATGTPVIDIGMIDTSQLYFAVNHFDTIGGIQTTASHNPANYNGFKICGRKGAPIGEDTGLGEIRHIAENIGQHTTGQTGDHTHRDLTEPYKDFIRGYLKSIRPLKLAIDASNGMAGKWAPIMFSDVPNLEIECINMETTGEFVHDPNPLVDSNLDQVRDLVRKTDADMGVCFDGDADRCMLIDENADIVRCDILTALLAQYFLKKYPEATIVYDLRSSRVVAEEVEKAGGTPRRQRVGHAFMKKEMKDRDAVFGGELSGHFYFKDNYYCDSGLLALVHVLNVLTESGQPLSELIEPLTRFHSSGERNFETPDKDATIAKLKKTFADGEIDELDGVTVQYEDWWFNVRKSNTEPLLRLNLEASSADLLNEKLAEVAKHLGTPVEH